MIPSFDPLHALLLSALIFATWVAVAELFAVAKLRRLLFAERDKLHKARADNELAVAHILNDTMLSSALLPAIERATMAVLQLRTEKDHETSRAMEARHRMQDAQFAALVALRELDKHDPAAAQRLRDQMQGQTRH